MENNGFNEQNFKGFLAKLFTAYGKELNISRLVELCKQYNCPPPLTLWSFPATLVAFFRAKEEERVKAEEYGLRLLHSAQLLRNIILEVSSHQLLVVFLLVDNPQDQSWQDLLSKPEYTYGEYVLRLTDAGSEEGWKGSTALLLPPNEGGLEGYIAPIDTDKLARELERVIPEDLGSIRQSFVRILQDAVQDGWENTQELLAVVRERFSSIDRGKNDRQEERL